MEVKKLLYYIHHIPLSFSEESGHKTGANLDIKLAPSEASMLGLQWVSYKLIYPLLFFSIILYPE